MAQEFPTTGISHHKLLPHIPLICIYAVNSSPCPGIAAQSLNSSSQLLHFIGACVPVQSLHGCHKDCLILIPFRLQQTSCFTLSLKCFSSDSGNCPNVGIRPPLQFSHQPRAGPILLTLLFPPQFLHPTEFCVVLYILFHWSGNPVHSQLVFCMHFCVRRCVPDVSVQRGVLQYSACTSVSKGVFLMYLCREVYSTSTHSSAILFSSFSGYFK